MAEKILTGDPTLPGVIKHGPTLTSNGKIPLADLDPTGVVNGEVVTLLGGVWSHSSAPPSADTASNLGAGSQVFKSKVLADFQFRSIIGASGITATQNANDITLSLTSTANALVILQNQQASGVAGGTATSGGWNTATLNTEVVDTGGDAVLAANQITLQPGTYRVEGFGTFYTTNASQLRLQNITDAVTHALGQTIDFGTLDNVTGIIGIFGRFTIAVAKVLELQYQVTTTRASTGQGLSGSFGTNVYHSLSLTKE